MILRMITLAILATTGCGDASSPNSGGNSDAAAGGFLNQDLFQFDETVTELEELEVANSIRGIDYVYLQSGSTRNKLALEENNLSCAIKRDEIKIENQQLVMSYEFDDSGCTEIEDKYINRMRVYINIGCSGQDLSRFTEGSVRQHIYTSGAADFCPDAQQQSTFINAELERESATEVAKVIGGVMTSGGSPCTVEKQEDELKVAGCNFYLRTSKGKKGAEETTTSKLLVLQTKDLVGKPGSIYYHAGTMDIRLNNWQGTLTYQAPNIGPTYELKNGEKTIQGSYQGGLTQAASLLER